MNLSRTFTLAALLVLALWGGLWIWKTRPLELPALMTPPVAAAPAPSLEARVAALREELAAERDARLGLEAEVEMLRMLLEDYGGPARREPPPGAAAAAPGNPANAAQGSSEEAFANPGGKLWFDAPALQEQGVSAQETDRLQKLFEESELQLLYLRDRATREGWAGTPRFLQEMYALRSALRESVGDETYDWLLYATQRTNRVAVVSVLSTGPAAQAGIQAGDLILRYDGRAIFKGPALQQATTQGEAGRSIPVDVQGPDGTVRRVTVPSGPLGIQLGEQRRPPSSVR
jgi:hypothetical protein